MELECAVQEYAWGVYGGLSSVAQMAKATKPSFTIEECKPYAELWMGTHPNGPSIIKATGTSLSQYIESFPQVIGDPVREKFGNTLPFLFKILSVNQALSIQAHPNKIHAEKLHKDRPDVYKDPNHKPEMTLALTPFQALCGFRPATEIKQFFKDLPELCQVIGIEQCEQFIKHSTEDNLKKCFAALMNASKELIDTSLNKLSERLINMDNDSSTTLLKDLFATLYRKYRGDVGCFSIYLLNYLTLQPGETMFLGPNVIHAYLLGDCMECMACSDNVVRAGLTPKYQDVETLVSMLEYKMYPAESRKFMGEEIDNQTTLFNPPVPDFAVERIKLSSINSEYTVRSVASASILVVIEGKSLVNFAPIAPGDIEAPSSVARGSVVFIPAGQTATLQNNCGEFVAYRALCVL